MIPALCGDNVLGQNAKFGAVLVFSKSSKNLGTLPAAPPPPFGIIQEGVFQSFPWTLLIKQFMKWFYLFTPTVLELGAPCFMGGSCPLCSLTDLSSHFLPVLWPTLPFRIHSWFCLTLSARCGEVRSVTPWSGFVRKISMKRGLFLALLLISYCTR